MKLLAPVGIGLLVACACGSASPVATSTATPDYVRWVALAPGNQNPQVPQPSPTPPIPIPPGTPACKAAQLQGVELGRNAAGGHLSTPIGLRNRAATACFLDGYPDVRLLDRAGRLLAQATGTSNRGTFFDVPDWVEPILMQPGTPPLPLSPPSEQPMSPGQGLLHIEWFDCKGPMAATATIDLPAGGGRMSVPFPMKGPYSPVCDNHPTAMSGLSRGAFLPAGIEWPPGPTYLTVTFALSAPASVKAGTTLVYFVTLTNHGQADYVLSPCPDYVEMLGAKQPVASYGLNCAPAGRVAAGASVKFEMKLAIPSVIPPGPNTLTWALVDGRVASPDIRTPITVT